MYSKTNNIMNKLKIIILLIMFGNCMIALPQVVSKIDDKLQLEMTQHVKSKKLRINILLSEQADQTEMLKKRDSLKIKKKNVLIS